jgi:hypothetical protein
MFKPTYLYIKTHNKTGLKYFGKTTKVDPYSYLGSGTYWSRHLEIHGQDISTEIFGYYTDKETCKFEARNFSDINDIVNSDEWANLIPENGTDGGFISDEQQKHRSICANKARNIKLNTCEIFRESFCSKLSESNKLAYKEGRRVVSDNFKYGFKDKFHTKESKLKIGSANKISSLGERNSQFGTCWINNNKENKKIKLFQLEYYLMSNWIKGRKMKF